MLSFTQKNSNNIFAIHGGGNIGLGLMADVVSQSLFNYKIIATSNDKFLQKIVNCTHQLWLQHTESNKTTHIKNVTIISREFSDIVKLYKEASILAICLTPAAMKNSAKAIAQGLIERYRAKQHKLNVLVLMNLPNCGEVVKETVTHEINLLLNHSDEAKKVSDSVKFVSTVADRIVTKIPEEEIKEQIKHHLLSCLSIDFIDQKWLNQQITSMLDKPDQLATAIEKFNLKVRLFKAEKNFALYASSQSSEVLQFPAIKSVKNIKQVEAIKNKYINGPHAIMAWLGSLLGCKTIASTINYPGMKQFIETMMDKEIAPVLMAEYLELTKDDLNFFKTLFLSRCEQSIDDPVKRVGRDPLRKINSGDRVRGILELQQRHNLNIPMSGLMYGIAAAILYAVKQLDNANPECLKIHEIYCKQRSYKDVLLYHGSYSSGVFTGFNSKNDMRLLTNILNNIRTLETMLERHKVSKRTLSLYHNSEFSTKDVMHKLTINKTATPKSTSYGNGINRNDIPVYPHKTFMKSMSPLKSHQTTKDKPIKVQRCSPAYGRQ